MNTSKNKAPRKKVVSVPVVMQMEALECGAACLTMILAYYGKWLPLEQVRRDCGVSRDGSNAKNILKAARHYGMKARGFRYSTPEDLKLMGDFPCILFWNLNHFVVLDGFKGDKAVLNDPARGRVLVSKEEFDQSFSGICLRFEPTEAFESGGKRSSLIAFAQERLRGSVPVFAFVIAVTLITTIISLANPAFASVFLDMILGANKTDWLYPFLFILLGLNILQVTIGLTRDLYMLKVQGSFAVTSNSRFMWHVLRLPVEFFSQRMVGDIASRRTSNERISNTLIQTFAPLVLDLITMVVYVLIMFQYSVVLSLVGIATVGINIALARYTNKKRLNISRLRAREAGRLSGATVASIDMIETIKASGAENGFFQKWAGYQSAYNDACVQSAKMNQYLGRIPTLVSQICNAVILILGVLLVIRGQWSEGIILAFQGFLLGFMTPVGKFINAAASMQDIRTEMERIQDVMDYPTDVEFNELSVDEDTEYSKLSGNIELKHVTFGYARLADPLISNFNLSIKQGDKIAIIGRSGCGKSTIAKLISGLYEAWEGEILFDGIRRDQIPREVFTGSLAVVDQDIYLFEDTIANNIKMWDKSIEDFAMVLAARDADIHDAILSRKDGYRHTLCKGGSDFSGGQRQRLEIARVLAQDPTIVIMDEATSALDAKTEKKVIDSIQARGITTIVVAHRLSTIRDADQILVLDKGVVVEQGTHQELYDLGGIYTQLVASE